MTTIKRKKPLKTPPIDGLDQQEEESRREPAKQLILVPFIVEDLTKTIQVGSLLNQNLCEKLVAFLWENTDIFAWSTSDMPGTLSNVIVHKLNIDSKCKPVY